MIVGSLVLILSAAGLLVGGLVLGSNPMLGGSIVASLFAAVVLYIGARQRAAARAQGVDEADGWDDERPDDVGARDGFRGYPEERPHREPEPDGYREAESYHPGRYDEPERYDEPGRYDEPDHYGEPRGFEEHSHLEKQGRFDDLRAGYEQQGIGPDPASLAGPPPGPAWQGVHTEQMPVQSEPAPTSAGPVDVDAGPPLAADDDDVPPSRRDRKPPAAGDDEDFPPGWRHDEPASGAADVPHRYPAGGMPAAVAGFDEAGTSTGERDFDTDRAGGPGYGTDREEPPHTVPAQLPPRTDDGFRAASSLDEPAAGSAVSSEPHDLAPGAPAGRHERGGAHAHSGPDDLGTPLASAAEEWVGGGSEEDDPKDEPPIERRTTQAAAVVARLDNDVFVIDGRPRYHLSGCVHLLGREAEPLPVYEAVDLGFTPCSLCEPDTVLATNSTQVTRH